MKLQCRIVKLSVLHRETALSHCKAIMLNRGKQRQNVNLTSEAKVEFWRRYNAIGGGGGDEVRREIMRLVKGATSRFVHL